jgi:hypothetical protein
MAITVTNGDGTEVSYSEDQAEEVTQTPATEADEQKQSEPTKEVGETADDSDSSKEESEDDQKEPSDVEDDEDADDSKEDEEEEEGLKADNDDEDRPKKKSGFKKRIERFQRRLSEKEQEAQYWREQALRAQTQAPKPQDTEPTLDLAPNTDQKPIADHFESIEEYVEAVTDWKLRQAEARLIEQDQLTQAKSSFQTQVEQFQAKVVEFKQTHDDFDEVVDDASDVILTPGLQESILSSDLGPQVMYELASNKQELLRINQLSPLAQAREIGKLEARITSKLQEPSPKPQLKTTTKAPPPPKPLSGKTDKGTKKSIYDADLSQQEFERLREVRSSL